MTKNGGFAMWHTAYSLSLRSPEIVSKIILLNIVSVLLGLYLWRLIGGHVTW